MRWPTEFHPIDIDLGRLEPPWRLVLEGVRHIDDLLETHGVDGPESMSIMVFDPFENARTLAIPGPVERYKLARVA